MDVTEERFFELMDDCSKLPAETWDNEDLKLIEYMVAKLLRFGKPTEGNVLAAIKMAYLVGRKESDVRQFLGD